MALVAKDSTVYDLLNDKMYYIPENQRQYVWTQNNWTEFLDDIRLVVAGKNKSHFIGSIVLKEEHRDDGIKNHFSIIDGQQRISTITVILCAIGLLFAEIGEKGLFGGLTKNILVKDIQNNSHSILSDRANKDISMLVESLINNVTLRFETNLPMITSHDLMLEKNFSKKIRDCFMFFYNGIKRDSGNDNVKLMRYLKAIQDIKYIDIVAKNDEDAFTIFEILNARGQPLSDFELLRNYILKNTSDQEKEVVKDSLNAIYEFLGKDTELFLKHYAMHKYGEKTDKLEKRPYKVITMNEKSNDKIHLLHDLMIKAKYYNRITTYENCGDIEMKIFSFFKPRRQQQFRPIVLSLMHQLELKRISQLEYEKALIFLYEFFIYFNVIGEQTSNKIEDVVYKYASQIENSLDDKTISEMRESMSKRIPNKESFRNSIKNVRYSSYWKPFSGSKKSENVRAIFEILEKESGYVGAFDECEFNIEHILSDALSEENSVIGNLMLLEKTINDKCKNKDIQDKILLYKDSSLFLPKQVDIETFSVENRTQWIVDKLYSCIENLKKGI